VSEQREAQAAAQAHRTVSDAKDDELDAHCSVSPLLRSEIYLLTMLCRMTRPHTARGIWGHQSACGWHDRARKNIWVHTRRRTCNEKVRIDSLILMSCADHAAAPSHVTCTAARKKVQSSSCHSRLPALIWHAAGRILLWQGLC